MSTDNIAEKSHRGQIRHLGDARGVGIMKREELIEKVLRADRGVYLITLSSPSSLR